MIDRQQLAQRGRTEPYRRAYLGGTFDCLHRGHLALFAAAHKIAYEVVVSVNTDEFAARYKRVPLMPLADRLAVLGQLKGVDRLLINDGHEDSRPAILRSGADCIVHGSDWTGDGLLRQMGISLPWLEDHGLELVILPYTEWTSTTQLLEAHERTRHAIDLTQVPGFGIVTPGAAPTNVPYENAFPGRV